MCGYSMDTCKKCINIATLVMLVCFWLVAASWYGWFICKEKDIIEGWAIPNIPENTYLHLVFGSGATCPVDCLSEQNVRLSYA